jgi:hypothetical protein
VEIGESDFVGQSVAIDRVVGTTFIGGSQTDELVEAIWSSGDAARWARENIPTHNCGAIQSMAAIGSVVVAVSTQFVGGVDGQCSDWQIQAASLLVDQGRQSWNEVPLGAGISCFVGTVGVSGDSFLLWGRVCDDREVGVWRSEDGLNWTELAVEPGLAWIDRVVKLEGELVAAGEVPNDPAKWGFVAVDGDGPAPRPIFNIADIAAVDESLVAVGTKIAALDHDGWRSVVDPLGETVLLAIQSDGSGGLAVGQLRRGADGGGPLVVWGGDLDDWSQLASFRDLPLLSDLVLDVVPTRAALVAVVDPATQSEVWITDR